jgi:hypothetical protein
MIMQQLCLRSSDEAHTWKSVSSRPRVCFPKLLIGFCVSLLFGVGTTILLATFNLAHVGVSDKNTTSLEYKNELTPLTKGSSTCKTCYILRKSILLKSNVLISDTF